MIVLKENGDEKKICKIVSFVVNFHEKKELSKVMLENSESNNNVTIYLETRIAEPASNLPKGVP